MAKISQPSRVYSVAASRGHAPKKGLRLHSSSGSKDRFLHGEDGHQAAAAH
jgi:hypothetical protein